MKPNQVNVFSAAVLCCLQQIVHIEKPGFLREFIGDVLQPNGHDGVHDDVALVHRITTAYFYVRVRPDANTALYTAASNTFAKTFCEDHVMRRLGRMSLLIRYGRWLQYLLPAQRVGT